MPTVTVTLSDELLAFVHRQVADGRGSSVEGYVTALVQGDQERSDWELIRQEGLANEKTRP